MKNNQLVLITVVLYSVVQFLFPIRLGDGALLPFLSLIVSIILFRYATFESFKMNQKFYITIFLYLALSVNVIIATESSGSLLGNNFSYFLKLTIIPSIIYIVLSVPVYFYACKNQINKKWNISNYVLIYTGLVSCAIFISGLLWVLSSHSV